MNLQIGCAVSVKAIGPEKGTLKWRLCISRRSIQLAIIQSGPGKRSPPSVLHVFLLLY